MLNWQCLSFSQLTTTQLYQLLKLRVDVFVVEQTCPYPELDDKDQIEGVFHLLGYKDQELVACARLLPKDVSYSTLSIGRVVTKQSARGNGLGHTLMTVALEQCHKLWPAQDITISAQQHLVDYYRQHGFEQTSEMYLEDDIPHVQMKRSA